MLDPPLHSIRGNRPSRHRIFNGCSRRRRHWGRAQSPTPSAHVLGPTQSASTPAQTQDVLVGPLLLPPHHRNRRSPWLRAPSSPYVNTGPAVQHACGALLPLCVKPRPKLSTILRLVAPLVPPYLSSAVPPSVKEGACNLARGETRAVPRQLCLCT